MGAIASNPHDSVLKDYTGSAGNVKFGIKKWPLWAITGAMVWREHERLIDRRFQTILYHNVVFVNVFINRAMTNKILG